MAKSKTYNPTNPNPFGNATVPPPVKPVVDDEMPDSTASPKNDCAGVRGGTAYRDYCDSCVGGTTGKTACCPTDSNFLVTKSLLLHINPYGDKNRMDSVLKYINMYKDDPDFKINTRLRLAHFLAQVTAETDGFTVMVESYNYSAKRIKEVFPEQFKNIDATPYAYCKCLFDKVYCCDNENGDSASHDGSKYRGYGIIQLTWKEMYRKFTEYYQHKFNDYSVNFVINPELLATNMKFSVLSALWEATHYKGGFNKYADNDDGKKYSRGINRGNPNSKRKAYKETERLQNLERAKNILCL